VTSGSIDIACRTIDAISLRSNSASLHSCDSIV